MSIVSIIQTFLVPETDTTIAALVCRRLFRALFLVDYAPSASFHERINMPIPPAVHVMWLYVRKVRHWAHMYATPSYSTAALDRLRRAEHREVTVRRLAMDTSYLVEAELRLNGQRANWRPNWGCHSEASAWVTWLHRNVSTFSDVVPVTQKTASPRRIVALQGNLPDVCWQHIIDYLVAVPANLCSLVDVSRGHRNLISRHKLNKVILLAYLQQAANDTTLINLCTTYQMYVAEIFSGTRLRDTIFEMHRLYNDFKTLAISWLHTPSMETSVVAKFRHLDYDLLYLYAFDCLSFADANIHALPASLFWQASKDETVRLVFMSPTINTPGMYRRRSVELYRKQMAMLRTHMMRELECVQYTFIRTFVDTTTTVFSRENVAMQPFNHQFDNLQHPDVLALVNRLMYRAECITDRHEVMREVVPRMMRSLAQYLHAHCRRLRMQLVQRSQLPRWFSFLRNKATVRDNDVRLRLRCNDRETMHLYFMKVTMIPCVRVWMLVVQRRRGVWPPAHLTPPFYTQPDVVVTWWEDNCWVTASDRATAEWLHEADANLLQVFIDHGRRTGSCAPCGRPLRQNNEWIGRTCLRNLKYKK